MKKINLIFLGALPTTLVGLAPLTSCNKDNYVMSELTKDIIGEMIGNEAVDGICSVPHPSYYCKLISDYLVDRIKDPALLGPECECEQDESYNVWCTIPATTGCDNWKPIILQGHMDMVVAGLSEEESRTTPIHPQIDGRIMHSMGYKTSLGADNGIGLSIMLELMKNKNTFDHGLIRCIFTVDEEVGLNGAHNLSKDVLRVDPTNPESALIPYLLNIDNEVEGDICRSCQGVFRDRYYRDFMTPNPETEPIYENAIDLRLDGLKGGHSGVDIVLGRASADRVLFEFMDFLSDNGVNYQIGGYDHVKNIEGQDVDIKWEANQLIVNGRMIFYTDASYDQISQHLRSFLEEAQNRYPGEAVSSWTTSVAVYTETDRPFIPADDSKDIAYFLGNNTNPSEFGQMVDKGLPYGVFKVDEETGITKASSNIGPVIISSDQGPKESIFFKMVILYRTAIYGVEGQNPPEWSIGWSEPRYKDAAEKLVDQMVVVHESGYQPWESIPGKNDQMINFLDETYEEMGIPHQISDPQGGMEAAEWITKNPDLICGCIGATIDNAHSVNETLHLDTVDNLYNVVLKTIGWMANPVKEL